MGGKDKEPRGRAERQGRRAGKRSTYVALLRAVNVGSGRKVVMEDLRRLFAEAGATDVSTYIQSGNVVFNHASAEGDLRADLEARIEKSAGFQVVVIVRTLQELAAVAVSHPFDPASTDSANLHVLFLERVPNAVAIDAIDPAKYEPEKFALRGRDLYLYLPNGMGRAKIGAAAFERALGTPGTARNWNTVNKLLELAAKIADAPQE